MFRKLACLSLNYFHLVGRDVIVFFIFFRVKRIDLMKPETNELRYIADDCSGIHHVELIFSHTVRSRYSIDNYNNADITFIKTNKCRFSVN